MRSPARGRRWVVLGVLVLAGMVVVALWGDDLRPAVHAFLQNAARRL
ncbi:hypothetical protein [Cellulomonas sp.]|nr:hypothetical protein [Cellulomonas sp.]HYQ74100.1 hypothetical protein [Cellulomonas sp.]